MIRIENLTPGKAASGGVLLSLQLGNGAEGGESSPFAALIDAASLPAPEGEVKVPLARIPAHGLALPGSGGPADGKNVPPGTAATAGESPDDVEAAAEDTRSIPQSDVSLSAMSVFLQSAAAAAPRPAPPRPAAPAATSGASGPLVEGPRPAGDGEMARTSADPRPNLQTVLQAIPELPEDASFHRAAPDPLSAAVGAALPSSPEAARTGVPQMMAAPPPPTAQPLRPAAMTSVLRRAPSIARIEPMDAAGSRTARAPDSEPAREAAGLAGPSVPERPSAPQPGHRPVPAVSPADERAQIVSAAAAAPAEAGSASASDPASAVLTVHGATPAAGASTTARAVDQPAERPQDFDALVSRLAEARAQGPEAVVRGSLRHGEFGPVSLQFRQESGRLEVTVAGDDPGFVPAVQAAAAASLAASPEQDLRRETQARQEHRHANPQEGGEGDALASGSTARDGGTGQDRRQPHPDFASGGRERAAQGPSRRSAKAAETSGTVPAGPERTGRSGLYA